MKQVSDKTKFNFSLYVISVCCITNDKLFTRLVNGIIVSSRTKVVFVDFEHHLKLALSRSYLTYESEYESIWLKSAGHFCTHRFKKYHSCFWEKKPRRSTRVRRMITKSCVFSRLDTSICWNSFNYVREQYLPRTVFMSNFVLYFSKKANETKFNLFVLYFKLPTQKIQWLMSSTF